MMPTAVLVVMEEYAWIISSLMTSPIKIRLKKAVLAIPTLDIPRNLS